MDEDIKPGDEVLATAETGCAWRKKTFLIKQRVTRTTASQFLIGGARYKKDNGNRVGGWDRAYPLNTPGKDQTAAYEILKERSTYYEKLYSLHEKLAAFSRPEKVEKKKVARLKKACALLQEAINELSEEKGGQ